MNTDAIALRALGAATAGIVLVAVGVFLLTGTGVPSAPSGGGVGAVLVLFWGLVGLGVLLLQAGLVGFVIAGLGASRERPRPSWQRRPGGTA
jgi:hypothetical protein